MIYKTTKKEFVDFKKESLKWQKHFGLFNWKLYFDHLKLRDDRIAEVGLGLSSRAATIKLNTELPWKIEADELKCAAFHEICEILVYPLSYLADQYFGRAEVEDKTHEIIRTLENVVFLNSK